MNTEKIVLAGNPNVGKSVIFGDITGSYVTVSNYPGTTVDISRGMCVYKNAAYEVIDTPGINSLVPHSEDELVALDILFRENAKTVVQVADSKNLRRTLLLTLQLIELGLPLVLDLNLQDEAKQHGFFIDYKLLAELLGVPVVGTTAITKKGIPQLLEALAAPGVSPLKIPYAPVIEEAIAKINEELPAKLKNNRGAALLLITSDEVANIFHHHIEAKTWERLLKIKKKYTAKFGKPIEAVLVEEKLKKADEVIGKVQKQSASLSKAFQRYADRVTMHPVSGVVLLAAVMYGMYAFVGQFAAGTLVDFFEERVFGAYVNPFLIRFFNASVPVPFIRDLFVGPYGILTVALTYSFAIIFPIVTAFFLFFGFLEDSGYLPRLTALSDRVFKVIGLNGRAILPMILGLGCGTMAVLTSRILDTKKERLLITILLALCIPCSAQLGVIMGLLGGISKAGLFIYVGVILALLILVGFVSARVIPGERSNFIQEIPPFRIPKIENIVVKTLFRLKWYLQEAVPLFMLGTFILFAIDKAGLLEAAQKLMSPVLVGVLGLPVRTSEVFIMGFLRRDYGAAGLYALSREGVLAPVQLLVSLVVITLFLPCIAQFFVAIKERGARTAFYIAAFVLTFSIAVGGVLNAILRFLISHGFLVL